MTFNCWQPFWTASYLNLGINSLLNKQVKRKNIKPESWWTGSKDQFVAFDFSLISDQSHIKEVLLLTHVLKRRVHVRCKVVPFQTIFVTLRHRSPHVNFTNFIFEQKKTKPGIKTRRSSQNPVVGITRPVALPVCADRQTSTADRAGREGTVSGQGRDLYLGKAGQFQGNAQTDVSSATGFFVFWLHLHTATWCWGRSIWAGLAFCFEGEWRVTRRILAISSKEKPKRNDCKRFSKPFKDISKIVEDR